QWGPPAQYPPAPPEPCRPADTAAQEAIAERQVSGLLGVVLSGGVAAGSRFSEVGFVSHRLKLCRHLAGMAWMDAVVPPTRRKQDRWIGLVGRRNVVGGKLGEEFPILRIIGVAVFIDRRRAAEQLGGASHVDDGHLAQQCTEALRVTGEHIGDERAA